MEESYLAKGMSKYSGLSSLERRARISELVENDRSPRISDRQAGEIFEHAKDVALGYGRRATFSGGIKYRFSEGPLAVTYTFGNIFMGGRGFFAEVRRRGRVVFDAWSLNDIKAALKVSHYSPGDWQRQLTVLLNKGPKADSTKA